MAKKQDAGKKYYTLTETGWDSFEAKSLRNNSSFEIGFIREINKQPDKFMVYPVKKEINKKMQTKYYLADHTLNSIQSVDKFSKYNMVCKPMYEVNLVKKSGGSFSTYKPKQTERKLSTRKIKQEKSPITKIIL